MTSRFASRALLTAALAASMTFSGYTPSVEAMPAKPLGLNEAVPSLVETVQNRRRSTRARRNNAAGAAIALGVLGLAAGAAIAANQRPRGYHYGDPYYADPYYTAPPAYYGPRYGYYDQPRGYYRQYRQPRGYYAPNRGYYRGQGNQPYQPQEGAGRM